MEANLKSSEFEKLYVPYFKEHNIKFSFIRNRKAYSSARNLVSIYIREYVPGLTFVEIGDKVYHLAVALAETLFIKRGTNSPCCQLIFNSQHFQNVSPGLIKVEERQSFQPAEEPVKESNDFFETAQSVFGTPDVAEVTKDLAEALFQSKSETVIKPLLDAVRYNDGKLEWSLVDFQALEPMVRVLMFGAKKYSRDNWKKGFPATSVLDSMFRHLVSLMAGQRIDPESQEHHVGHILCNAMFLSYMLTVKPEFDDLPGEKVIQTLDLERLAA